MTQLRNFNLFSLYNQRMNKQLLACCLLLSQEQCEEPTHSFFPNIISYWNHILFGDLIMLRRLLSNGVAGLHVNILSGLPDAQSPIDIYGISIVELESLRSKVDGVIELLINTLSENDLESIIHYKTTEGLNVSARVGDVLQHMFNHQTHHRGQLTCILSQFNIDVGCTDLPAIVPEMSI